jgi:osmotically-inducible protein OsmY
MIPVLLSTTLAANGSFALGGSAETSTDPEGLESPPMSTHPVTDAYLKGQIVSSLALNPYVSAYDIKVQVENGIAYLSGKVNTSVERDIALEVARGVDGLVDVRSTIDVVPGSHAAKAVLRKPEKPASETPDDANTTAAIKSRLMANRNTSALDLRVSTHNGVVTLRGVARSDAEKELAQRIAENQSGVVDVENHITVARR